MFIKHYKICYKTVVCVHTILILVNKTPYFVNFATENDVGNTYKPYLCICKTKDTREKKKINIGIQKVIRFRIIFKVEKGKENDGNNSISIHCSGYSPCSDGRKKD